MSNIDLTQAPWGTPLRQIMLARIRSFCQMHGLSEREFSEAAVGDHRFILRLRAGDSVRLDRMEAAERYMAKAIGAHCQQVLAAHGQAA